MYLIGITILIFSGWMLRRPKFFFDLYVNDLDVFLDVLINRGIVTSEFFKSATFNITDMKANFIFGITLVKKEDKRSFQIILPTRKLCDDEVNECIHKINNLGINHKRIEMKFSGVLFDAGFNKVVVKEVISIIWDTCALSPDGKLALHFYRSSIDNKFMYADRGAFSIPLTNYQSLLLWFNKKMKRKL